MLRTPDIVALAVFLVAWLFYEPMLTLLAKRRGGVLNTDMTIIRAAWMAGMARRQGRFFDGQLLGQALSSCSFFASSNLILIAAVASALFGGERTFVSVSALKLVQTSSRLLFEVQMALVLLTLARSLLDFIWAIRQLNYCIAALGAAPEAMGEDKARAYADAAGRVLNPAQGSFNSGVRGYYFALAAAAWLFGAWALLASTLGALTLLLWRQRNSPAARAIRDLRRLLEEG